MWKLFKVLLTLTLISNSYGRNQDYYVVESSSKLQELPPTELTLKLFFSGIRSNYFVSSDKADIVTAEQTCKSNSKKLKLLSIESEEEFGEILPFLQGTVGVDAVWSSGIETIFKDSKEYVWSSTALPLDYTNFAPKLAHLLPGLHRSRRGVHGTYPGHHHCSCDNECSERPSCAHVNCTISGETCEVEQPICTEPTNQDCYLIDPAPNCTVTCPDCVLKRGKCHLIQPICKVKEGTPSCRTSRRGYCRVIPSKYEVSPGKCHLIQEPCVVTKPETICERPIPCNYRYNPNGGPQCRRNGDAPSFGELSTEKHYNGNCAINCDGDCPNPCPPDNECTRVFHCVPDLVCQAPPVICPPPIYHCLPAQLVKVRDEEVVCDEPETICDPPIVECTQVEKKCEEDVITCPPPKTVCTPAVSHCPTPEYSCTKPIVECHDPSTSCPELPECFVPPKCYSKAGYHNERRNCDCSRTKREAVDKGKLLKAKCVSLKKEFDFKWTLEECNTRNYFICEEPYNESQ